MNNFQEGGVVKMTDGRQYIVFAAIEKEGKKFLYLMTMDKPVKILFAEELNESGNISMRVIDERAEKEQLLQLFKEQEQNR